MTDPSPLDRLAEAYGIEPSYEDARGETVVIPAETKRRLLAAMGADASSDEAVEEALAAIAADEAARIVAPVHVDRTSGADVRIPVRLPDGPVAFSLLAEHGPLVEDVAAVEDGVLAFADVPLGYHDLELRPAGAAAARTRLVVCPSACWLPEGAAAGERRLWGLAVQLYLLRSDENWGIGDFADLKRLVMLAAAKGCDVIGLNPLHALFPDTPEAASPYSPASRLLLNVLSIAVTEIPEYDDCAEVLTLVGAPEFADRLDAAQAAGSVDYTTVAELKMRVLEPLHARFLATADAERRAAFRRFVESRGEGFRRSCLFLALRRHFAAQGRPDWHDWPEDCRRPDGRGARAFAEERAEQVDIQEWMQWIADGQLAEAADAAAASGMAIGLYRDLAVGADRGGAETWANPTAVLDGVQVGAPPDIFMPAGQAWGLPPFHPRALRDEAYASFVDLVRANMRHAGGLRIDHVMGLMHLYCIPDGATPAAGAYLAYPLDDLLGILALESRRARCLVVGEDLGTVPTGFRERMAEANVLSYRVLFFEMDFDAGTFAEPEDYPVRSLAVAGSHDLATLRGWWLGRDNDLKEALGLFPSADETAAQRARRERDKAGLLDALRSRRLLANPGDEDPDAGAIATAAHAFLAGTGSLLAVAQWDDLGGEEDQVNVPGTNAEHPNWRRRYRLTLEEAEETPEVWETVLPLARRGVARS